MNTAETSALLGEKERTDSFLAVQRCETVLSVPTKWRSDSQGLIMATAKGKEAEEVSLCVLVWLSANITAQQGRRATDRKGELQTGKASRMEPCRDLSTDTKRREEREGKGRTAASESSAVL